MADLQATWTSITEKNLQSSVMEQMKWLGWKCYHTQDSRRSAPGFPDLVAVKDNRLIFVEFKSERGMIRTEQVEWLDALVEAASGVYLVRPSTQDAFMENVALVGSNLEAHWRNQR